MSAVAEQHATWSQARARLWGGKVMARLPSPRPSRPAPRIIVLPVLIDRYGWPIYVRPVFYDQCDGAVEPPPKTLRTIALEVSSKHGVSLIDMKSVRRDRVTVHARQEAIYRMRTETLRSLPEIARFFNRDHTTAIHAIRVHAHRVEEQAKNIADVSKPVLLLAGMSHGVFMEDRPNELETV